MGRENGEGKMGRGKWGGENGDGKMRGRNKLEFFYQTKIVRGITEQQDSRLFYS